MKATPSEPYQSLSGRTSLRSSTYTRTNRHTGRIHVVSVQNPHGPEWTEAQQATRQTFAVRVSLATQWRRANFPSDSHPLGTPLYQALLARWKSDHRYPSVWALLLHLIQPDGTITISD